jgi:hypothetical protein
MSATDRRQALGRLGAVLAGLFALGPLGLLSGNARHTSNGTAGPDGGSRSTSKDSPSVQVRPAEKAVKRNV